jgi:Kef-type K+ transport system membrane component KefB
VTNAQLSIAFFVQMFLILALCRAVGWANSRYFGQPQVVGEMIAGVVLGPSLFGLLLPEWQQMIFPPESLKTLYICAQLGIGLFMFLVGIEFSSEVFRRHARTAIAVSVAGMAVPFAFALFLAGWLMQIPGLFAERTTPLEAFLFLGAAISITAFPVLARIIYDRGLAGTAVGTLTLSAGAICDAAAWCVLAVVLASFGDGHVSAATAISGGLAYTLIMLTFGRWFLMRLSLAVERSGRLSHTVLATVLALLMICVTITDSLGIHAVFGGFILGVAMPRGLLARELRQKLEPLVIVFLLPMFFTYSGLNTQLEAVSTGYLLFVAIVVLGVSILSKGVACWAAARLSGEDNRTALAVGSLMNARGLMELIILNIGLQQGVIEPALFSILVLMTIVTTLMASPLFEWFYGQRARQTGELGAVRLGE